jgi:WD40 repeat protein
MEAPRLCALVRGDLDWIVMKCLEKDRARRYGTAIDLATDLKRHLDNEPVVARPPSRLYEFQKTVRRHKVVFAAATAVIAALAVAAVVSTWEAIRAKRAEREQMAQSYTSDMSVAKQAWDDGHLQHAQELLHSHIPKHGEPDVRGFEWRYLWNLFQPKSLKTISSFDNDYVGALTSSPGGSVVVVCCEKTIRVLESKTGNELFRFSQPEAKATNIAYAVALASGAPNILATHRGDGVVTLWDLSAKKQLGSFPAAFKDLGALPFSDGTKFLALSPDGNFLAFAVPENRPSEMILWDISSKSPLSPRAVWTNEVIDGTLALAFTPDNRTLLTGESWHGAALQAWDVKTGAEGKPFPKLSSGNIHALAISGDGVLVAQAGIDSRICVSDITTRKLRCYCDGHSGEVLSLSFSPDNGRLISGGADGTVRIWDIPSGKKIGLWHDPRALNVHSVVFASEGSSIFSANRDEVRIWSAEPDSIEQKIETQQEWGTLDVSPNGKWLVTSGSRCSDGSANFPVRCRQ